MTRSTTLLLILDACRADYVSPERTPFLHDLQKKSLTGMFESPPGFAQRTIFFTGTYPDTSGNFSAFGYNPDASPFKWMRHLGPLAHAYRPRKLMFPARVAVRHVTKWVTGNYHTDPAWIPGPFLPFFEVVEDTKPIFDPGALPHTSIFDLCREHGKRFLYGAHPVSGNDEEIHKLLLKTIRSEETTDLFVAQFSNLDERGHHHGPMSDVIQKREVPEIDRKIAELSEALHANYDHVNLFILGDHGMSPVERKVDILAALRKTGLRMGKDYVVFLDSTFAKFWFESDRARDVIVPMLEGLKCGHVLTEEEKREHRIAFEGRRYGDLMFAADPGVLFWPDYFHVVEHDIRGMHGYVDKRLETYGLMILNTPGMAARVDAGLHNLVDLFPTLCDLVGVPTPATAEGSNLLAGLKAAPTV